MDIGNTVYAEAGLRAAFAVSDFSDEAKFRAAYAEMREQDKHAIAVPVGAKKLTLCYAPACGAKAS